MIAEIRFRPLYGTMYVGELVMDGEIIGEARGFCAVDIMHRLGLGDGYKLAGDYYKTRWMMSEGESFCLGVWQEAITN